MNDAAIIQGSLVDVRNVGQHKSVKLTVHVPEEYAARVVEMFGWPTAARPVHVAVAKLREGAETEDSTTAQIEPDTAAPDGELSSVPARRNFVLSQKAYLLCEKPSFAKFLVEKYKHRLREGDNAATFLRSYCGVNSRANILPGTPAAEKFYKIDSEFTAWERVAA